MLSLSITPAVFPFKRMHGTKSKQQSLRFHCNSNKRDVPIRFCWLGLSKYMLTSRCLTVAHFEASFIYTRSYAWTHLLLCLWMPTDAIPVEAFNAIVESERYDLDLSLKCQNEAFTSEMDSEFLGNTVWLLQALWPLLSAPLLPPFSFYSSSFIYPTTHLQGILTFILLSSTWLCKERIWFCYCCVLAIKEITI